MSASRHGSMTPHPVPVLLLLLALAPAPCSAVLGEGGAAGGETGGRGPAESREAGREDEAQSSDDGRGSEAETGGAAGSAAGGAGGAGAAEAPARPPLRRLKNQRFGQRAVDVAERRELSDEDAAESDTGAASSASSASASAAAAATSAGGAAPAAGPTSDASMRLAFAERSFRRNEIKPAEAALVGRLAALRARVAAPSRDPSLRLAQNLKAIKQGSHESRGELRPLGEVPGELAQSLVDAADQLGTEPDAASLRALSDAGAPAGSGLANARAALDRSSLVQRAETLEQIRDDAGHLAQEIRNQAAERGQTPAETKRMQALWHLEDAAGRHANELRRAVNDAVSRYPGSLAGNRRPTIVPANREQLGAGRNATTFRVNYDFDRNAHDPTRPKQAVFKADETRLSEDAGLSTLGVNTSPDGRHPPLRLSQRAKAQERLGALLGLDGLVVRTELASVRDGAGGEAFGLLMAQAPGGPPLERVGRDLSADEAAAVEAQLTRAEQKLEQVRGPIVERLRANGVAIDAPAQLDLSEADGPAAQMTRLERGRLRDAQSDLDNLRSKFKRVDDRLQREVEVRRLPDSALADPHLRQALANAQLLDAICGQADRNMGNLFIDTSQSPPRLTLIDNDLAFGTDNDAYDLLSGKPGGARSGVLLQALPKVVDRDLRRTILALDGEQIRNATAGLLSTAEQNAAIERLRIVQGYVKKAPTASIDGQRASHSWRDPADQLFHNHDGSVQADEDNPSSYYGEIISTPFSAG